MTPPTDPADDLESTYELYEDAAGEWRWRLKAPNGHIIATSHEGYTRKADAKLAISRTQRLARTAEVRDVSGTPAERNKRRLERARAKFARLLARPGSGTAEEADE